MLNSPPDSFCSIDDHLDDVFAVADRVQGRAEAGTEELVVHLLADHVVVAAAFGEQEHARGDLGVAQQGGSGHGVVPVAVDPLEGQDGCKAGLATLAPHLDAASPGEGKPDQAADTVPEVVLRAQATDERFQALVQRGTQRHSIGLEFHGGGKRGLCFGTGHQGTRSVRGSALG